MKRWLRRSLIGAALIGVITGVLFEAFTRVGRGWWSGEPFYDGRPASFWASEMARWETRDPVWVSRHYVRRSGLPPWAERWLPEPRWLPLLDGDPDGLAVLQVLRNHPARDVQDWALIGIERIANEERGPYKIYHPSVILTAQLFEVDEGCYKKVTGGWRSRAELEEVERRYIEGRKDDAGDSVFALLGTQKLLMGVEAVKIEDGKEGVLLSFTKEIHCLPSPARLRKGLTEPQKIETGVVLRVQVQVASDRRHVRARIVESSSELEGTDKVSVLLDEDGREGSAEIPSVKECTLAASRTIPDGATFLMPLQYQPAAAKEKGRWLVVRIESRIYIALEDEISRALSKMTNPD